VNFGGEVGPSGNAWSKAKAGAEKEKEKKKVEMNGNGHINGLSDGHHVQGADNGMDGVAVDKDHSDDEAGPSTGERFVVRKLNKVS